MTNTNSISDTPTPLLVAPKTACALLGIGNTKLYELIGQKRLAVVKFGKATRITMSSIEALATAQAA